MATVPLHGIFKGEVSLQLHTALFILKAVVNVIRVLHFPELDAATKAPLRSIFRLRDVPE